MSELTKCYACHTGLTSRGGAGGLDAGTVPHFSSLDAGQYGRLKVMTVVDIQHSEHILSDRYR